MKENFQQDKPLHVLKDESNPSTFTIYTQDDFDELEDSVVQDVLRRQHIVVTNRPHAAVSFKAALNRLAPLQRVTEIQGYIIFQLGDFMFSDAVYRSITWC